MKSKVKIIPIFLSIFIFITSVYNCTIDVCASDRESGGHTPSESTSKTAWEKFDEFCAKYALKAVTLIPFAVAQIGAIVDNHDFEQFIKNHDAEFEFFNRDLTCPVTIEESTNDNEPDTITFSADFIYLLKKALREYAEETNGYVIYRTQRADMLSPSAFSSSYQYQTFREFSKKYGIVAVTHSSATLYLYTIDEYTSGDAGIYVYQYLNNAFYAMLLDFKTWKYCDKHPFLIMKSDFREIIHSWEEAEEKSESSSSLSYDIRSTPNAIVSMNENNIIPTGSYYPLYSEDGRDILVFLSKNALQNYSVDHRTVYFGSGFYDETGAIKVSYGDLEDYLDGKYDNLIDDLRDIIGDSNLSEDEIEKLVDKLLGGLGDISDSVDESNSWLEKIYNKLSDLDDYVENHVFGSIDIADQLDEIIKYLKKIRNWTMLDAIFDGVDALADWIDLIHDILSDVDSGAEAAVATLSSALTDAANLSKSKFPFCLPWDLYDLVTMWAAEPETPVFHLEIKLESWDIDYTHELDFSELEPLSVACRNSLAVIYALALINMTYKVIGKEGEA